MNVSKNHKDWDEFIPLTLFAHRTSVLDAIGDSPFYVFYGREPRLPIDLKYLPPAADDLSTSVLYYRKRVVEKVELAQNLERKFTTCTTKSEGLLRSKDKRTFF